ncbi:MAG: hypothetical protein CK552_02390 [Actinobacteria bacterium]|nr:MAG: hypothetical protein CK552_02390 [Actinomycetota bacterium]
MTGLIYVVIIALWAAVLIPMWLRRHDRISEVRSTKKFRTAMQSLGSDRHRAATLSSYKAHPAGAEKKARSKDEQARIANSARAAQRRLMILSLLAVTVMFTLALALLSVISIIIPMVAAALVLLFVVASAATVSSRAAVAAVTRTSRLTSSDAEVIQLNAATPANGDDWENWDPWAEDDAVWEAVPTTLPTYVNAPRASQVPRRIDRARPGEWTGSAMVDAAHAMQRKVAFAEVDAKAETAEIPAVAFEESRRAVG